ncbi:MAG: transglycosylase SLT domain-containing protein, partial [Brochothrix thermosphacta]|uniref:transglycosylase SLT domain-containing protein n=1 Tax=Brochothrix thermosphacta TaxID=2756 RepID=UPI003F93CBF7
NSMKHMESITEKSAAKSGTNLSKGFVKGRTTASKEIDAMVNEINAKMGQAKAQQEKLAYLKSQRQGAVSNNDTKGTVKYDEQIARAQAQMTKYQDSAKGLAASMQSEFDAVPRSMDKITNAMAQNEGQIESMRKRIKQLQLDYANQKTPVGDFETGFKGTADNKTSLKTADTIQKQSAKMNKLIRDNDQLTDAYAQVESRAKTLRSALGGVNTKLGESSIQTGKAAQSVKSAGEKAQRSSGMFSKFGGVFNRTSNNVAHGTRRMNNGMGSFSNRMRQMIGQVFVFALMYKGMQTLGRGMMDAAMTNDQFTASLNEIKVNLLTAFYPIYTAIMPALNALMAGLAKATAYLAGFIATLFGTTYSAAKKGAEGLYNNVQAMKDTATTADKTKEKVKKLQRSLMGFDEINRIGLADDTDDIKTPAADKNQNKPSVNFDIADPVIPEWVNNWAEKFKKTLADLFEPMQAAWNKHGQKVMDAWKYALSSVGGLIKAIGKSFMEVWTNGTGERFISNLLILFADILNIIGDIATAFKNAWEDDGRGTALIQSIFNTFNNILELLHSIAISFRKAWNSGEGEKIAANLLDIFTNVSDTIGNLAGQFKKAWDTGDLGTDIFKGILKIINSILGTIKRMTKATTDWAGKLDYTPYLKSIKKLLNALEPLTDTIGEGLEWFYKNVLLPLGKFTIENVIPVFLDVLSAVLKVLNAVLKKTQPFFQWFMKNFLIPIAKWTGGIIISVLKEIVVVLETLADWIENSGTMIGDFVSWIGGLFVSLKNSVSGIVDWFALKWDELFNNTSKVWNSIMNFFKKWGSTLLTVLSGPVVGSVVLMVTNWDRIKTFTKETWNTVKKWTSEKWNDIKNSVSESAGNASKKASEKWDSIKKNTSNSWDNVKKATSEKWNDVKKSVSNAVIDATKKTAEKWDSIKKKTSDSWSNIKKSTSETWGNVKTKVSDSVKDAASNAARHWSALKTSSKEAFDKVTGWASGMGTKIGKGFTGSVEFIKKSAAAIGDGIVNVIGKAVNGMIKGINWVLSKVGAGKKVISDWKIGNYPNYAKGTKSHPGGPAMVNDGSGSNWQEMYKLPNGKRGLFPRMKNMMVNLPKGSQVLDGARTAKAMAPRYANGIFDKDFFKDFNIPKIDFEMPNFDFDFGGISSGISNTVSKVKDTASEIWDNISNPKKLLNLAMDKFVSLSDAVDPAFSIAKGGLGMIKDGAVGWLKDIIGDFGGSSAGGPNPVGESVERWRPYVLRGFSETGVHRTGDRVNRFMRQIQTESNGNPGVTQNGYTDVNTGGNEARGLMQITPATWRGVVSQHFRGQSLNPFNGYDSIKVALKYIEHYRNPALGYNQQGDYWRWIGRGQGYENGGLINKEGMYRLGEGDKDEMVIPLSRPARALDLIKQSLGIMGMDFTSLQMPEVFRDTSSQFSYSSDYSNDSQQMSSGGLNDMSGALLSAIKEMSTSGSKTTSNSGDIIVNIGGKEFGRVAVSEINKYHQQIGRTELN